MTYTIEFEHRFGGYFMAIPNDTESDAFTLCGDTEEQAREFAARIGLELTN